MKNKTRIVPKSKSFQCMNGMEFAKKMAKGKIGTPISSFTPQRLASMKKIAPNLAMLITELQKEDKDGND